MRRFVSDPQRLQAWRDAPDTVQMPGAGGESLQQVWLFLVAPFVGGALAVLFWKIARPENAPMADDGSDQLGREDD